MPSNASNQSTNPASDAATVWQQINLTLASATAEPWSSTNAFCRRALIQNTSAGSVNIGPNATSNARELTEGQEYELSHDRPFNLAQWFAKGAGGEVLKIVYVLSVLFLATVCFGAGFTAPPTTAFSRSLLRATSAGDALTVLGITPTNSYVAASLVNVVDYGATGDGVTDDTAAIQDAIDNGHTIFFPSGTYLVGDTLTVWDNQRFVGDGGKSIVKGDGTVSDIFECSGVTNVEFSSFRIAGGATVGISAYQVDNLTVNAMTIDYCNRTPDTLLPSAILCRVSTNIVIANSSFLGNGAATDGGTLIFGDNPIDCKQVRIIGNRIWNAGLYGIACNDVSDAVVMGNYVNQGNVGTGSFVNGYGILFYDQDWPTTPNWCKNNIIVGNLVTNAYGTGIYLVYPQDCIIQGNTVSGVCKQQDSSVLVQGGICINTPIRCTVADNIVTQVSAAGLAQTHCGIGVALGTNNAVVNNTVEGVLGTLGDGIWAGGSSGAAISRSLTLQGNRVRTTGRNGILFDSLANKLECAIVDNSIAETGAAGLSFDKAIACLISRNIIRDWATAQPGIIIGSGTSTSNCVAGNFLVHNGTMTSQAISIRAAGQQVIDNVVYGIGTMTIGIYDNAGKGYYAGNRVIGNVGTRYSFSAQVSCFNGNYNSGSGAPSTTPLIVGEEYLDATAKIFYRASGTSSSADWKALQ